ncbi:FAD binding domain-containing protein [Bradyrhizobium sp.]|uniref:FAD binding domain-containing protein n=1 Tax=Bradyrhizobium sp. TaxID=376 RepID=UPI003C5CB54A
MKARPFRYFRAETLEGALKAYSQVSGDRCYLAGGQSLVPSLSLRLQAPELIIDISRIKDLHGVTVSDSFLRVGALTRHFEILESSDVARHAPLLKLAAPFVAHPAIRNKGTIGGTIALADPSAEFPAMTLALDAELEIANADGIRRRVKAIDYYKGLFETDLAPGEILTAILIPLFGENDRCVFDELARRRGDYAIVGAGVQARFQRDCVETARIAFFSVGPTPVRALQAEAAIAGGPLSAETIGAAQAALDEDLDPEDDAETSSDMRKHLARVLLGRLLIRLGDPDGKQREDAA